MRDVLLARIRPLLERLASDLAELAAARFEAELERMEETFAIALSAYASDGDGAADLLTAALGPDLAAMLKPSSTTPASAVEDSPRPTKRSKRAATPGQSASSAAGNVAEPHRVPSGHRDAGAAVVDTPPPRFNSLGRRIGTIICSKCGYVGGNARGCGTAHETVVAAEDLLEADTPAPVVQRDTKPSNVSKVDRFARIEAAAAARRAGAGG